jgi:hypothetical protein
MRAGSTPNSRGSAAKLLLCTLVTFALCADPKMPAAISFDTLTVPIAWTSLPMRTCMGLNATSKPADAEIQTAVSVAGGYSDAGPYSGRVTLTVAGAKIELSMFSWPRMTANERRQLLSVYRATLWHELGHLITARMSIAAENARPENTVTASSRAEFAALARARADAAFARVDADQNAYDDLTEHGIRQAEAPLPLGGADTVARCDAR